MNGMARTTTFSSGEEQLDLVDGIDELAAAIRTLRTTDEVTRFLRDLCTRAELEAALGLGSVGSSSG